jgi:formamidopyrimidine-DNA glycosylase
MPELPEVEYVRRMIARRARRKRIRAVRVLDDPIMLERTPARAIRRALEGRVVRRVRRHGKHFWLELDRRPWPLFHLGMTGWFHVYRGSAGRPRFLKLELEFDDGTRIAMSDPRRLGRIRLRHDPARTPPISALGRDAWRQLPPPDRFAAELKKRTAPVKAVLLDQGFLAGIGNWIADEVLYQSCIAPRRRAHRLRAREARRLRAELARVIRVAVERNADSDRFPARWLFHRRWGRRRGAVTVRGEPIQFCVVGGRTTAWVPARQK